MARHKTTTLNLPFLLSRYVDMRICKYIPRSNNLDTEENENSWSPNSKKYKSNQHKE